MSSILLALRKETKDIHSLLHKNPILLRCQENQLDLKEYIQMLLAFYQPWKKLIPSVNEVPINAIKPLLITRHQLLYNDLIALNVSQEKIAPEKKEIFTEGQLIGMCYVMIGSSMGASSLSQNIKKTLGNQPISYLSMSPKEAGWPLLSAFLNNKENKDYPQAAITASNTFKLIQTHLSNAAE